MRQTPLALGLMTLAAAAPADTLVVYTYDSFVADWGPGPQLEAGFEATCACDIEFVGHGDGAALLSRLRLEGAGSDADVVLGLDTGLIAAARAADLVIEHGVEADYDLPGGWDMPDFVPYDWGYFAFVGQGDTPTVSNLRALADSDLSIIIQDPRSSTPGLGLLMWVEAAYPDSAAEIWEALADNIVTVTPGWSEAFGLWVAGEADYYLSYTTSPAYHLVAEGDDSKFALAFDEGHYMQIEVGAVLANSDQPDLARAFLAYLVSDEAQAILPVTNWMYPVRMPGGALPDGFFDPVPAENALLFAPETAAELRDGALQTWLNALSR